MDRRCNAPASGETRPLVIYVLQGVPGVLDITSARRLSSEALDAPQGKELVVFENSTRIPFLAEPEAFNRAVGRVKEETWSGHGDGI